MANTKQAKQFGEATKRASGDASLTSPLLFHWELIATLGPGKCEHCRKNRKRTHTFQIQDEHGECLIVGENCLGLFVREPWKNLETQRKEQLARQITQDEKHYAEMVSNPDNILTHAMCYLLTVHDQFSSPAYDAALDTFEAAREAIRLQ